MPPQISGMTAPDPGLMHHQDEAVVVTYKEGANVAKLSMPGKEPGSRVMCNNDPEGGQSGLGCQ